MKSLWRSHPWLDAVGAGVLAVAALNLHVSGRGDALSSLGRGERRGFYALLAVMAVVLLAATFARRSQRVQWCRGCLGFSAASGIAAMLLDVQDGPVRTIQLVALLGLFLAATATVRLSLESDDHAARAAAS